MLFRSEQFLCWLKFEIKFCVAFLLSLCIGIGAYATVIADSPNLASQMNGCWIIPSSSANFENLDSANIIDGNMKTEWSSFQPTREEYVDLKWDFDMQFNNIRVFLNDKGNIKKMELYYWSKDNWFSLSNRDVRKLTLSEPIDFKFPTIQTKRFRLVMKNDSPAFTSLNEIQAFGHEQPILRLSNGRGWSDGAWSYFAASRFDNMINYYKALDEGKSLSLYQGNQETVIVHEVKVNPGSIRPGNNIKLRLRLKLPSKLTGDYAITATIGERETLYFHSDYTISRNIFPTTLTKANSQAGEIHEIECNIYIPIYAPHGKLDIMLNGISLSDRAPLILLGTDGKEISGGKISQIDIRRFAKDPQPDRQRHTVKVDSSDGTVFSLDGKKVVPYMFTLAMPSFEQFHYYSQKTGIKIFQLQIYPYGISTGNYRQRNYNFVAQHIRNLMRVIPDAYVIIEMDLRARAEWVSAHPEGCMQTPDGRSLQESFCSKEYHDEAIGYISDLVKFVQSQPWSNRVVGYNCEIGMEGALGGRGVVVGDYNPQAIAAFRTFVREKYGDSVELLREKYADLQVTFETVYPTPEKINAVGADGGTFLDPKTQRLTIDYHEFISSMVPKFLMECGGIIKNLTGGRALVGTYGAYLYSSLGVDNYTHQGNHFYTSRLLTSPNVDFFAAPQNYLPEVRHAGGPYRSGQPDQGIRLNGKLQITECDQRTFRSGTRFNYTDRSREETIAILKRDLGHSIIQGTGSWFADWSGNYSKDRSRCEPFFLDTHILAQIKSLYHTYHNELNIKHKRVAEVAVFMSGTSGYYLDNNSPPATNTIYPILNSLAKMGAPYDEILLEDIVKSQVQNDYKCYIFLNAYYLTDKQKQSIQSLKRDGKTLVWIYAPGYAGENSLIVQNIAELTGFPVVVSNEGRKLTYRLSAKRGLITLGLEDVEYIGHSSPVSPWFYINETDPSLMVLGQYSDGKTAVAARDFGNFKSIYFSAPITSAPMLRNILLYAGCNIYVDQDIYMDANRDFLMFTNSFDQSRTIDVKLPEKLDVFDLETKTSVARNTNSFKVNMQPGEIRLYRLKPHDNK